MTEQQRPSTFGLSKAARLAEIARLRSEGWQPWEIQKVFDLNTELPSAVTEPREA